MKRILDVIKRPLISEKSTLMAETNRTYAFEVLSSANKYEVKAAVEKAFNVDVISVNTMVVHGEYKQVGRHLTKRSNWKKALVQLKDGQKIEFYQGA